MKRHRNRSFGRGCAIWRESFSPTKAKSAGNTWCIPEHFGKGRRKRLRQGAYQRPKERFPYKHKSDRRKTCRSCVPIRNMFTKNILSIQYVLIIHGESCFVKRFLHSFRQNFRKLFSAKARIVNRLPMITVMGSVCLTAALCNS